jgi:transposase
MLPFFARLPSCLVGMEACGTSHHWARELIKLGHEVRLMPPAYVKPYVKRGKTARAKARRAGRNRRHGKQDSTDHLGDHDETYRAGHQPALAA